MTAPDTLPETLPLAAASPRIAPAAPSQMTRSPRRFPRFDPSAIAQSQRVARSIPMMSATSSRFMLPAP